MANWSTLKASVASIIKTNGNQEITGQLLQNVLDSIISNVGQNSSFKGFAVPATAPGTPDGPCFYLANTPGLYANFGGVEIKRNSLNVLSYTNGSWSRLNVFFPYYFGTYFLQNEGETNVTIAGRTISISGVRRSNHAGFWDEMDQSYSFDMPGQYDYILVRKNGQINPSVGKLEFSKGTHDYFWQESDDSEYDVFIYSDGGFWKSQIPEVQNLIDKYYNPIHTKTITDYPMGVLFNSSGDFGTIMKAFFNHQTVQRDGYLSELKIQTFFTGEIYLLVMREGITEGKWLTEVSRTKLGVNYGTTTLGGLRISVKYGDYIAIASTDGRTIAGKVESTGIGRHETDVNADFDDPFYVTTESGPMNDITFQYSFKVLSLKTIGAVDYLNEDIVQYSEFTNPNSAFQQQGWLTHVDPITYNGILHKIRIQVNGAGTVTFGIGILDQWNKAIIRDTHDVVLASGINEKEVEFPVRARDRLFVRLNGDGVNPGTIMYFHSFGSGVGPNFFYSDTVEQPLNYLAGVESYGGGIPLTFWVRNRESIFAFKEDLEEVRVQVETLENVVNAGVLKIKSPLGAEFQIIVNEAGVLSTISLTVHKWLALGNSITLHGIASFWWGNWGMAATTRDKDWVHVLQTKLATRYGAAPAFEAYNIAAWETAHNTYDKTQMDGYFDGDEDLVVLKIGENVSYDANYQNNFDLLIKYIRSKAPQARIVVCGCFWTSSEKDTAQKNASDANSCIWVKLSQLDNAANKSTLDTQVYGDDLQWHTISDGGAIAPGVAAHPGDLGMTNIANAIYAVL
jgi:hypothetical protein